MALGLSDISQWLSPNTLAQAQGNPNTFNQTFNWSPELNQKWNQAAGIAEDSTPLGYFTDPQLRQQTQANRVKYASLTPLNQYLASNEGDWKEGYKDSFKDAIWDDQFGLMMPNKSLNSYSKTTGMTPEQMAVLASMAVGGIIAAPQAIGGAGGLSSAGTSTTLADMVANGTYGAGAGAGTGAVVGQTTAADFIPTTPIGPGEVASAAGAAGAGAGSGGTAGKGIMDSILGGLGTAGSSLLKGFSDNPSNWLGALASLYGAYQNNQNKQDLSGLANSLMEKSDPFASQRGQYQEKLAKTYSDPMAIYNTPEYQGLSDLYRKKIEAKDAASGRRSQYSGRELEMQGNFLNYLNNYRQGLVPLTGANINPNVGPSGAASTAAIGQGSNTANDIIGALGMLFPGMPTMNSKINRGDGSSNGNSNNGYIP